MTVDQTLAGVQFVVGPDGKATAALLDISTWQTIVALLEEAEDQGIVRAYLARRRTAQSPADMGLIPWEDVERELDSLEDDEHATMG